MTVYICEEYQKEYLFHELARKQKNTTVMGIQLLSLKQAVQREEAPDSLTLELQLMQKLSPLQDQFHNYGAMFRYPVFLQEVLDFARLCALYGIAPDDLPEDRENEKELRRILEEALRLPLEEAAFRRNRKIFLERLSRPDVVFVQGFEQEPFYQQLKEEAAANGAQHLSLSDQETENIHLRHTLSMEKEIEAVAQDICTHGKTCTIVLSDANAQMPHVAAVFARYGIRYSWTGRGLPSRIHEIYCALAEFAMSPDSEHLLHAISAGAFSRECSPALFSYLERRQMPDTLWPQPVSEQYRSIRASLQSEKDVDRSWKDFARIEKEMEQYIASIQPETDALVHVTKQEGLSEAASKLAAAYTVLQKSPLLQYQGEYELAMQLRSSLQTILPLVHTEEDALFAIRCLEGISARSYAYASPTVQVTDLTHPVPRREITYVLGADGTCYPGFAARKGLFDEDYVSRIPAFPTLRMRYELYMKELEWIRRSADTLYYSYYTNDSSGREKLLAFAIEDEIHNRSLPDNILWNLIESRYRYRPVHALREDTARALFTDDGVNVQGSISSIESWFRCPYSYFIHYGLRIQSRDLPKLDAALVGTIHHAAMELLIRQYRKAYPSQMNEETLRPLIHGYFEALAVTGEKDRSLLLMSEERMLKTLIKTGRFFQRCEQDSASFIPTLAEADFHNITFADHVILKGTIDRIDVSLEHALFRIIDYKSSTNDLNEKQVRAGLKLQLLTYMLAAMEEPAILEQIQNSAPACAYYYMIKEDVVSDSKKTAAVTRNKRTHEGSAVEWKFRKYSDDPMSRYVEKERFLDAHSVNGWSFAEDLSVLDSGGILKNTAARYSLTAVRECLEDVYRYFHETLLSEDGIALKPVKYGMNGPCEYCDYRPVCRFHGEYNDMVEHSEVDLKEAAYED